MCLVKRFDAFKDPWIYVETLSGKIELVSVENIFENMHNYKCVANSFSKMEHAVIPYAVLCFITTIFMDMRLFYTTEEQKEFLEQGQFPKEKFAEYIKMCEKSGTCFNIYDDKKPFMQIDKASFEANFDTGKIEDITSPVSRINMMAASGNNVMFYRHVDFEKFAEYYNEVEIRPGDITQDLYSEEELIKQNLKRKDMPADYILTMESDEFMRNLVLMHFLAGDGGRGYSKSILTPNKVPIFTEIEGKNLFETVVYNSMPVNNPNDKPMWRWDNYLEYLKPEFIEKTFGILSGRFFPVRTIRIENNLENFTKDGKEIRKIVFTGVVTGDKTLRDLHGPLRKLWTNQYAPDVYIRVDVKDGEPKSEPITYIEKGKAWLDLTAGTQFYNISDEKYVKPPVILSNYLQLRGRRAPKRVHLKFYFCERSQASIITTGISEYDFPEVSISSERGNYLIKSFAEDTNAFAKALVRAAETYLKEEYKGGKNNNGYKKYSSLLLDRFFNACEDLLVDGLFNDKEMLEGSENESDDFDYKVEYRKKYIEGEMRKIAENLYANLRQTNKNLVTFVKGKETLRCALNKITGVKPEKKKGEKTERSNNVSIRKGFRDDIFIENLYRWKNNPMKKTELNVIRSSFGRNINTIDFRAEGVVDSLLSDDFKGTLTKNEKYIYLMLASMIVRMDFPNTKTRFPELLKQYYNQGPVFQDNINRLLTSNMKNNNGNTLRFIMNMFPTIHKKFGTFDVKSLFWDIAKWDDDNDVKEDWAMKILGR